MGSPPEEEEGFATDNVHPASGACPPVHLRTRALLVALLVAPLVAPGPAAAAEPSVVLSDWQEGHVLAGAPVAVDEPHGATLNGARFPLTMDACPRTVLLDLLYAPEEAGAAVPGVGDAAILFEWRAELWRDGEMVASRALHASGYGRALGETDGVSEHEVRIWLRTGANVSWDARVRGWEIPGERGCLDPVWISEVEANPAGLDAGNEWVELHNPGATALDVGGWTVEGTHGDPTSFVLPPGTVVPAGGRLVVTLTDGQTLDNVDEVVRLTDGLGTLRDETPMLSDEENDARTWQRDADGQWRFDAGTPGEP